MATKARLKFPIVRGIQGIRSVLSLFSSLSFWNSLFIWACKQSDQRIGCRNSYAKESETDDIQTTFTTAKDNNKARHNYQRKYA